MTDQCEHCAGTGLLIGGQRETILREEAERYGVSPEDITGYSKRTDIYAARQAVARRLYEGGLSLNAIGAFLNRHHTTILDMINGGRRRA